MEIRILTQKAEMLAHLDIVKQLYPDFTVEKYGALLDEMLKANYQQVIVTKNNKTRTNTIKLFFIKSILFVIAPPILFKYLPPESTCLYSDNSLKKIIRSFALALETTIQQNFFLLAIICLHSSLVLG